MLRCRRLARLLARIPRCWPRDRFGFRIRHTTVGDMLESVYA